MKKPRKKLFDTKAGGVLKTVLKGAVKSVPVLGDVVENVQSQDGGEGKLDWNKLGNQVIRILILIAILLGLLETGKASETLQLFF